MNNKPIVIIGGGGHASVLLDILTRQHREIKAIVSPYDISNRKVFKHISHFQSDDDVFNFSPEDIELVNAIGATPRSTLRRRITEKYLEWGFHFATVISDSAYICESVQINEGVQILTRAVIHPGTVIDNYTVINTGAIIEHDCRIGAYNFIAPGAVLCGQVRTHENVFIGAGATVIPNLDIQANAIVAAGAVLVASLNAGKTSYASRIQIK